MNTYEVSIQMPDGSRSVLRIAADSPSKARSIAKRVHGAVRASVTGMLV